MSVRRATAADKPAIFDFIKSAYGDRWQYKFPDRWRWQFEDNPFRDAHEPLPVWIAEDGGRIVGQSGAMIEPLKIGPSCCKVGWSVDTIVLPSQRGRGIGFRLQEANQQAHDVFMSLSMSHQNRRIKQSLGGVPMPPLSMFRRRLRCDVKPVQQRMSSAAAIPRFAARMATISGIDQLAASAYTAAQAVRRSFLFPTRLPREPDLEIQPIDRFGPEIDSLWDRISGEYYGIVKRDHSYLNWKFCDQPHMHHLRFVATRRGSVCGYLILRKATAPEPNVGLIVDLVASRRDHRLVAALISFATTCFLEEGVETVRAATTVPEYKECFRALGFKESTTRAPMCHAKDSAIALAPIMPQASWFFGLGDHDLDQYPLAKR